MESILEALVCLVTSIPTVDGKESGIAKRMRINGPNIIYLIIWVCLILLLSFFYSRS
jgi:hypothetical protein